MFQLPGTRLGVHDIAAQIGAGPMRDVYRTPGRLQTLAVVLVLSVGVVMAQPGTRLFDVALLDHINIRATNPTRSAHFYQSLFGGELLWIESIPPNPSSPAAESWYLELGQQYLSVSPVFPDRNLPVGLDHVSPSVHGYTAVAATSLARAHDIEMVGGTGGWLRDPDGMIYQLRNDANISRPAVPPAQAKPKAGDTPALATAPFAAVGIREITLRATDVKKTADFFAGVFGGFTFGDTVFRVIPRGAAGVGMESFAIAVKEFSPAAAERALRARGIEPARDGAAGGVRFADPDGISVRLVAAVTPR